MISFELKSHFHVKVSKNILSKFRGILKAETKSENNDFA